MKRLPTQLEGLELSPVRKNSRHATYCVYQISEECTTYGHTYFTTLAQAVKHAILCEGEVVRVGTNKLMLFSFLGELCLGYGAKNDYSFQRALGELWSVVIYNDVDALWASRK